MSNYPPPGGYQGGGYPPPGGGYQGGGYPPPGPPAGKTQTLNLDYNVAALLAYLPCCVNLIASIMWLVTEPKENRFLRFHSIQSLLLMGVCLVIAFFFMIIGFMVPSGLTGVGIAGILFIVEIIIFFGLFVLDIIAMIKGYQGQMWKMPVLGDIAEKNS